MHAVQPKSPQKTSPKRQRHSVRKGLQKRQNQNTRAITFEMSVKLLANGLLSVCAFSALIQVLPQQRLASERFGQIQAEVKLTQDRVEQERGSFTRYFDPQQSRHVMQEQSNQVDPAQRPIVWLEEELTQIESESDKADYREQPVD
ncbi:MAG: hypothetical protein ACRC8A_06965 [Microcoleaceae cyanobacterium]